MKLLWITLLLVALLLMAAFAQPAGAHFYSAANATTVERARMNAKCGDAFWWYCDAVAPNCYARGGDHTWYCAGWFREGHTAYLRHRTCYADARVTHGVLSYYRDTCYG